MDSSARIYKASPMDFLKFSGSRTPANNKISNFRLKNLGNSFKNSHNVICQKSAVNKTVVKLAISQYEVNIMIRL